MQTDIHGAEIARSRERFYRWIYLLMLSIDFHERYDSIASLGKRATRDSRDFCSI